MQDYTNQSGKNCCITGLSFASILAFSQVTLASLRFGILRRVVSCNLEVPTPWIPEAILPFVLYQICQFDQLVSQENFNLHLQTKELFCTRDLLIICTSYRVNGQLKWDIPNKEFIYSFKNSWCKLHAIKYIKIYLIALSLHQEFCKQTHRHIHGLTT